MSTYDEYLSANFRGPVLVLSYSNFQPSSRSKTYDEIYQIYTRPLEENRIEKWENGMMKIQTVTDLYYRKRRYKHEKI